MKKAVICMAGLMLAAALVCCGVVIAVVAGWKSTGTPDKTADINVMLGRCEGWKQLVTQPVVTEEELRMIDGSTATIPITAELYRQFFGYTDAQVMETPTVYHDTTHNAYVNLIDRTHRYGDKENDGRTTDLIFVTPPSEDEKQYAAKTGITLDLTPVARDGFVFITHKDNPVESLTAEQIQDIYTGKITNWKAVGGSDQPIRAYQRGKNSGSQTAMEQMVMKGKKMTQPISTQIYAMMGQLVDAVAEYENGPSSIGYTYYYYINNLYKNENIKVLKVDGIAPSNDHLISGAYPFSACYYAVMRADAPESSPARKLRDFLVTGDGQDLIAMAGYCKISG